MRGSVVRGILVAVGIVLIVVGLVSLVLSFYGLALYALVAGAVLLVAAFAERRRYRSAMAERTHAPAGPGGGEVPGSQAEMRFRATSEVFIDPTTGHRMRVLVDPASGERRYVAEA